MCAKKNLTLNHLETEDLKGTFFGPRVESSVLP